MPKDPSIKTVLIIGSGPVVIGQAAEFDYSGSQACLSMKEEGVKTVLLNSNPATIQTDFDIADRIYIEPITVASVRRIAEKEHIDSVFFSVGGQTALNLAVEMESSGLIKELSLKVLGTEVKSISLAEDRRKFHERMLEIGEPVAESHTLTSDGFMEQAEQIGKFPVIARTSFSLGGSGGSIMNNMDDLKKFCDWFFKSYSSDSIEVETSLLGLKEIEYEVIRDNTGNCITVCNMENLDPMGVHTGESIVVTPSQTLSDIEYQMLRRSAIRVISSLGIIGACNIQFALDPVSEKYFIVEVNPRTSRSSALASKASGYPIARIASKIAVGYNLNEIRNPITRNTFAAFEPSLDYVTVKIPRWPFDKFHVTRTLGVQMKSIGEVMGIGRTFEEAMMKAIASLDNDMAGKIRIFESDERIREYISVPSDLRLYAIFEALFRNFKVEEISARSGYDPFFVWKIRNVVQALAGIEVGSIPENLPALKTLGISDAIISSFAHLQAIDVFKYRLEKGIFPQFKSIDTCSGEFVSTTPYMYSTYEVENERNATTGVKKIMIIGSGPNRISQGLEFDYGSVKAIKKLRSDGYTTIMVNSNPETVSTDFDISDVLYFEPLTLEHISNIVQAEKPAGIIIQFSGQTGQNMALELSEIFGPEIILGTKPQDISHAEDRTYFAETMKRLGILQPEYTTVSNLQDVSTKIEEIRLPVILRSSFIIGGRAMDIINDRESLMKRSEELFRERPGFPILISRYVENADEIDVDFVSDGQSFAICGVCLHIEEAGTHSGDATMIMGRSIVPEKVMREIERIVSLLVPSFNLVGLSNLQLASNDSGVYIIELNTRSSRSVPFVSKATGINWVAHAVDAMLGGHLPRIQNADMKSYFIKIPVFPFKRFEDLDPILSPEMKSTGEGMGIGSTPEEAITKAMAISGSRFREGSSMILSVNDRDKSGLHLLSPFLKKFNGVIYATIGTHDALMEAGIKSTIVYKIGDIREPRIDQIISTNQIFLVLNTPSEIVDQVKDSFQIRRIAIFRSIPLITNMRLARFLFESMERAISVDYREIREYY
ncbi:MAG: carbamoyl-phosphate synthase large subunit [Thermoplasmatales archaeon B_DKE]|nr:MAG: carbamoyl-phosphate synthase large subunit [Thermoplasmatales archaeon B_DKE]